MTQTTTPPVASATMEALNRDFIKFLESAPAYCLSAADAAEEFGSADNIINVVSRDEAALDFCSGRADQPRGAALDTLLDGAGHDIARPELSFEEGTMRITWVHVMTDTEKASLFRHIFGQHKVRIRVPAVSRPVSLPS